MLVHTDWKKRSHHLSVLVSVEFLTDSLLRQILHRNVNVCVLAYDLTADAQVTRLIRERARNGAAT